MAFNRHWLKPLFALALSACCMANPTGGQVTSGSAAIQQANGQMTITQSTDRAIIQWQNFSIGPGESVRFIQPGALSAALNRVVGIDPSIILGALRANGQVFLVNPNGVVFGPGSTVDVSGLVVSTLGITDQDFLNSTFQFTQDASLELASIVNQGQIKVSDNGFVILASPLISNEGLILANQGRVALAAGEKTSISFDPNNLIHFEVDNLGPENGKVLLPQQAVSDVLKGVVSNPGVADSTELVLVNGEYELRNGSGIAINSGEIKVDGATGADAGYVRIDSTRATVITETGRISAKGDGANSSGGDIFILSEGQTAALRGSTVDIGAGSSGDGGFAELSGSTILAGLAVEGDVNQGKRGTYLIDPAVLTVANGPDMGAPDTVYEEALEASAVDIMLLADESVVIENIADNEITLGSDISISIDTTMPGFSGLVFSDPNDTLSTSGTGAISVTTAGSIDGGRFDSDMSVSMLVDGSIGGGTLNTPFVNSPTFSFLALGDAVVDTDVDILSGSSSSGSITINESGDVDISGLDTFGPTGDIILNAGGNITSAFSAGSGRDLEFTAGGGIDVFQIVAARNVSLSAGGNILNEITEATTGNFTARAGGGFSSNCGVLAGGAVDIESIFDINMGGFDAGADSVLVSTGGTIADEMNPMGANITGNLLVRTGGEVSGRSATLSGSITGDVTVVDTTPGDVFFNGSQVTNFISPPPPQPPPNNGGGGGGGGNPPPNGGGGGGGPMPGGMPGPGSMNKSPDMILTQNLGLADRRAEQIQNQLGANGRIGPLGNAGPGQVGPGAGGPGPGDRNGNSAKDGPQKKKERGTSKRRGPDSRQGRSPLVAQAGLGSPTLSTAQLTRFRVEALPQLSVNLQSPSPFDQALLTSQMTADDVLDLTAADLRELEIDLGYNIHLDVILSNPNLRAGDLFELTISDLGDIPINLPNS